MRHEFVGDEAPRLLFEQDEVLAHPRRPREIEGVHTMRSLRRIAGWYHRAAKRRVRGLTARSIKIFDWLAFAARGMERLPPRCYDRIRKGRTVIVTPINPSVRAPGAATDSTAAWLRLAVAVALSTIGGVGMWSVVVVLPAMQAEFGVDRAAASLPYTLTMLGFAAGGVADGQARRPLRHYRIGDRQHAGARRRLSRGRQRRQPVAGSDRAWRADRRRLLSNLRAR